MLPEQLGPIGIPPIRGPQAAGRVSGLRGVIVCVDTQTFASDSPLADMFQVTVALSLTFQFDY